MRLQETSRPLGLSSVVDSFAHLGKAALLARVCRNAGAQLLSALLLARQVFMNFFPMIEVISQAGMNVGQPQRGESQHNFFSGRALLVMVDDGFETDAGISDPDRPVV